MTTQYLPKPGKVLVNILLLMSGIEIDEICLHFPLEQEFGRPPRRGLERRDEFPITSMLHIRKELAV